MVKTIILNCTPELHFDAVDFLAYPCMAEDNYMLIDVADKNALIEVAGIIEQELFIAGHPANWQLVVLFAQEIAENTDFFSFTSAVKLFEKSVIPNLKVKPKYLNFINTSQSDTFSYKPLDIYGIANKEIADAVFLQIDEIWEKVSSYDKGEIVFGKGFDGISDTIFKGIIENSIKEIKEKCCDYIKQITTSSSSNVVLIDDNQLQDAKNAIEASLDSIKEDACRYSTYQPSEEFKKVLLNNFSIYNEAFQEYRLFHFIDSVFCSDPNKQIANRMSLQLFLVLLTENPSAFSHNKLMEVSLSFNNEAIPTTLSRFYFAMHNGINELRKKIADKSLEITLKNETPTFPSHINTNEIKKIQGPEFGYFYQNNNLSKWLNYLEAVKSELSLLIKETDKNIREMDASFNKMEIVYVEEQIADIFKKEESYRDNLQDLEELPVESTYPDILGAWDAFVLNNNNMSSLLGKMPRKRISFIALGTGLLVMVFNLFFFSKQFAFYWLPVYLLAVIAIYIASLWRFFKPVKAIINLFSGETESLFNKISNYVRSHKEYLERVQLNSIRRSNYKIISSAAKQKSDAHMKIEYHIAAMENLKNKTIKIMSALDMKPDEHYNTQELHGFDEKCSSYLNKYTQINNDKYNTNISEMTFKMGKSSVKSSFSAFINEISLNSINKQQ